MTIGTPDPNKPLFLKSLGCRITRQVSQEALTSNVTTPPKAEDKEEEGENMGKLFHQDHQQPNQRGSSPMRCVSEFDKLTTDTTGSSSTSLPNACAQSNSVGPLHNRISLEHHRFALRIEAELHPLRLILTRLMSHSTHNKKGIFNTPVDPEALGLPDYFQIISQPMDLGTVKVRLHSISYKNRQEAVDDIRLVFTNAMTYNPPNNMVHLAAEALSEFFEEQLISFIPDLDNDTESQSSPAISRTISSDPSLPPPPPLLTATSSSATNRVAFDVRGPLSGTRGNALAEHDLPSVFAAPTPTSERKPQRCRRGSKRNPLHSCQFCQGHKCDLCHQGCLALEPTLLICNGTHCAGAKIRKGGVYYIAPDGSRQYCERCHSSLPSVLLPASSKAHEEECRYKRDLLKRKNDEEVVERWLSCVECGLYVHQICAMYHHNHHVSSDETKDYLCAACSSQRGPQPCASSSSSTSADGLWTFVAGSVDPVPLREIRPDPDAFAAETLHETPVSRFMQSKVRALMEATPACPRHADKTLLVRVISDCDRSFHVPEVVRKHFRMTQTSVQSGEGLLPKVVPYRSKAIMLFQKVDGMDVCIFCMYVHEYDRETSDNEVDASQEKTKRVYIAYLDSVEHFQPRVCRTPVFQEMLISYLATARKRGYETAHIWACPPMRGNSFVFWNHPASQRTPNQERLVTWYNETLSHAVERGVVVDVKSLYETCFEPLLQNDDETEHKSYKHKGPMVCPPLLEGDYWIEEAVRLHAVHVSRHHKTKTNDGRITVCDFPETCGSTTTLDLVAEIAKLLRERIVEHSDSALFRRPVNAAALGLKDYHTIISKPMDLGTMYSRLVFGEYPDLAQLVADFDLMIANAELYNPKGHFVHTKAEELSQRFFLELSALAESTKDARLADRSRWNAVSLSLDLPEKNMAENEPTAAASEPQALVLSLAHDNDASASGAATAVRSGATSPAPPDPLAEDEVMSSPLPLSNGPLAVHQSMVGSDAHLFEKVHAVGKSPGSSKKVVSGKRRHSLLVLDKEQPPSKRRRQAWLGEQVGASVRRMRPYFYACSLSSSTSGPSPAFGAYAASFDPNTTSHAPISSRIADGRHSFLEFSQLHHLEFDTLRRSKYSTAILLYHLHNDDAPGVVPMCSGCRAQISNVRWHKTGKVIETHPPMLPNTAATSSTTIAPGNVPKCVPHPLRKKKPEFIPEELCGGCYEQRSNKDDFMPIQVTLQ